MKKKIIALVITIVMVLAAAVPAVAAGPTVTTSMKGNDVTITVKDGNDTYTKTVAFAKNTTQTYDVDGYTVKVEYNGGGVKNATIVSVPSANENNDEDTTQPPPPPTPPATAGNKIYLKGSGSGKDDFRSWDNVFYVGFEEDEDIVEFQDWHLVIGGNKDLAKNIVSVQLTFITPDENVVWLWVLDDGYSTNGGGNNPGWVVVAPLDWELISGKDQTDSFLTVSSGDPQFNISGYGRFENPYITIAKEWADENPGELEALFDIYKYDADAEDFRGDIAADSNGTLLESIGVGETYKVAAGKYVIAEQPCAGYIAQADKIVTVKMNDKAKFTFINVPEVVDTPRGYLDMAKTVDGTLIAEWDSNGFTLVDVIDDISFKLYIAIVDDDGNPVDVGEYVTDGTLLDEGNIIFSWDSDTEVTGWYAVVESFAPDSLAETLFEVADPVYVYFYNGTAVGGIGVDFDYGVLYTIVNGYNQRAEWGYPNGIGYEGLNNSGDIFFIGVTNTETGIVYPSFCAHAGSKNFAGDAGHGCEGYMCSTSGREIEAIDFDDFLSALNYIEDNYGSVAEQRVITQVVTWALLGNIDVYSDAFAATKLTGVEKAAIIDVISNSKGYKGESKIVDVAYLTCELHGTTEFGFANCQPQLVPIYGEYIEITFDNTEKKLGALEVTIEAVEQWDEVIYEPVYETKSVSTKTLVSLVTENGDGTFNSGHTYVAIDVAAASDGYLTFAIADSSPENRPAGYSYNVKIEGDQLTVYFDDNLISANVGAYVVNNPNEFPGNAPSHHGLSVTVDMPEGYGEIVYLYFHNEGGIKWYGPEIVDWVEVARETITQNYAGPFSLVIKNGLDEAVYNEEGFTYSDAITVDKLAPGEYTCVLYEGDIDDDNILSTQICTVLIGETVQVEFKDIILERPDVSIKDI